MHTLTRKERQRQEGGYTLNVATSLFVLNDIRILLTCQPLNFLT